MFGSGIEGSVQKHFGVYVCFLGVRKGCSYIRWVFVWWGSCLKTHPKKEQIAWLELDVLLMINVLGSPAGT